MSTQYKNGEIAKNNITYTLPTNGGSFAINKHLYRYEVMIALDYPKTAGYLNQSHYNITCSIVSPYLFKDISHTTEAFERTYNLKSKGDGTDLNTFFSNVFGTNEVLYNCQGYATYDGGSCYISICWNYSSGVPTGAENYNCLYFWGIDHNLRLVIPVTFKSNNQLVAGVWNKNRAGTGWEYYIDLSDDGGYTAADNATIRIRRMAIY